MHNDKQINDIVAEEIYKEIKVELTKKGNTVRSSFFCEIKTGY